MLGDIILRDTFCVGTMLGACTPIKQRDRSPQLSIKFYLPQSTFLPFFGEKYLGRKIGEQDLKQKTQTRCLLFFIYISSLEMSTGETLPQPHPSLAESELIIRYNTTV